MRALGGTLLITGLVPFVAARGACSASLGLLAADEGVQLTSGHDLTLAGCGALCADTAGCNSFTACASNCDWPDSPDGRPDWRTGGLTNKLARAASRSAME